MQIVKNFLQVHPSIIITVTSDQRTRSYRGLCDVTFNQSFMFNMLNNEP